jgi:hypothetical protein
LISVACWRETGSIDMNSSPLTVNSPRSLSRPLMPSPKMAWWEILNLMAAALAPPDFLEDMIFPFCGGWLSRG